MTTTASHDFHRQLGKFRLIPVAQAHGASADSPASKAPFDYTSNYNPSADANSPSSPPRDGSISPGRQRPPPSQSPTARSKRVATACDFCRKRKKKCDFRYPNCSACSRLGVRCTVSPPSHHVASASVPRDQLENLQKRVQWLEQIVKRKTGIAVSELPTGSILDGQEETDSWHQVPLLIAHGDATVSMTDSVSSTSTMTPALEMKAPGIGSELPNVGEIFRDQLEHRQLSVSRMESSSVSHALRLSSLEEAERVANQYFDHLGYQYPFLHRSNFMTRLKHIYAGNRPSAEVHYSYHITMAIALQMGSADEAQSTEFYRLSQRSLSHVLLNEDLSAICALLSLALYTLFAAAGPSVWHILGTAIRLATSLGLHKSPPSSSLVEEEMAKRVFWSLYNLDRLIAATLGRPLGISDEDISVDLPRELNDDWVEAPGASSMTIPLQVIKLRRIFSQIYRYLYNNQPRPPPEDITATLCRFQRELDEWRKAAPLYPPAMLYSTSYYDYLYYTTLLLMHRPSARNPAPNLTSIVTCFDSSIQVIRSYWDSYAVGNLKWIWLTLSQVYFAGITILWCLEQNARAVRNGLLPLWQPDEQMMHQGINATTALLEEFGERRPGVEKLAGTFRRQSAMVLSQEIYQQQQQPQRMPFPPSVSTTFFLDDDMTATGATAVDPQLAEQLFYLYGSFQEELSTYYDI